MKGGERERKKRSQSVGYESEFEGWQLECESLEEQRIHDETYRELQRRKERVDAMKLQSVIDQVRSWVGVFGSGSSRTEAESGGGEWLIWKIG